ncbi:hypothetical protein [Cupriavidus necator]|uniref:hypothetical protein n=1 Tax=Cupriavidus necator TaxID=106590 RepID=UPI00339DA6E2
MSVEKWGWVSVAITGSVGLALGAFLFVHANGLDSGQNQAVAAWVQAVGSVAAIGVTGWLFLAQRQAERKKVNDAHLLMKLRSAQRAQAIGFWAVEAMEAGAESLELGGASNGLRFRPERFDQLREMMERAAEATEDNAITLIALAVCNSLNEAHNDYVYFDSQFRDIWLKAMWKRRDDTREMYDRIVTYQHKLEALCATRGIRLNSGEGE